MLERSGELVTKSELIAHAWPDIADGEGVLRVTISGLRKILEKNSARVRYLENVTGQGYRFITQVTRLDENALPAAQASSVEPASIARFSTPEIIGREQELSRLGAQFPQKPLVTIVGPGGIGKTALAIAAAHRLHAVNSSRMFFVDLSSTADPGAVSACIAAAIGLPPVAYEVLANIASFLKDRQTVLLLDNCEQVIESVASVAQRLLELAPELHILATSREPLRAVGESVLRLSALELPRESTMLTVADALGFSAVQLFCARATHSLPTFELTNADVELVVEICRRLDGLPLAIELAATLVGVFSVREIAANLDNGLRLLTTGHRKAPPRQQTLHATLDWSYQRLSHIEQKVLRRLAVFAGSMDLASATAVVTDAEIDAAGVLDILMDLVAKSLVMSSMSGDAALFHLLDTSRNYALEKLQHSGESTAIRQRHAQLCCLWGEAVVDRDLPYTAEDNTSALRKLGDVRAALDWCFSNAGDLSTGVQLTAASAPLWFQLCVHDEYVSYIVRALSAPSAADTANLELELRLNAALGDALLFGRSFDMRVAKAFERTLELAVRLENSAYRAKAQWGLWLAGIFAGDYRHAIELAGGYRPIADAAGDPASALNLAHMLSFARHLAGDHTEAREHADSMLKLAPESACWMRSPGHRFDYRVLAFTQLTRILWIQGLPEQAVLAGKDSLRRARSIDHGPSICLALKDLCLVATCTGDLPQARRHTTALLDCATRHSLPCWQHWGRYQQQALATRDPLVLARLRRELTEDRHCRPFFLDHMATLHPMLVVPLAFERAESDLAGWCTAEILRAKAVLMLTEEATSVTAAEQLLKRSLEVARRQGELAWQLRTALTLGRLWQSQQRLAEAHELLSPIYSRFTEGFATSDLLEARTLLAELREFGAD